MKNHTMTFTNLCTDKRHSKYKDFILNVNTVRFAAFIHFIFNSTTYNSLKI